MTIQQAIEKAMDAGYLHRFPISKEDVPNLRKEAVVMILQDYYFWQSLGKAMGWGSPVKKWECFWENGGYELTGRWENEWHNFIDHLAIGRDAESFFKEL